MLAGRTRPSVSQALPEKNPGECSLIEEIRFRTVPRISQTVALRNRNKTGQRHDKSISIVEGAGTLAGGRSGVMAEGALIKRLLVVLGRRNEGRFSRLGQKIRA